MDILVTAVVKEEDFTSQEEAIRLSKKRKREYSKNKKIDLSSICEHNKQKKACKDCKELGKGGNSICEHNKQRTYCKECNS